MDMGAVPKARNMEAPGGCTSTSAPTPCTRRAVSFTKPEVRPTTSITMHTSTATASALTAVRIGRCMRLAITMLFSMLSFRLVRRAQIHQLRVLRLLQLEFLRRDLLIKRCLLDGHGHPVVIDGTGDLQLGRVTHSVEILVTGIVYVFHV